MGHYFSNWLDDDCIRCEYCGVNPFSPKAKGECPESF